MTTVTERLDRIDPSSRRVPPMGRLQPHLPRRRASSACSAIPAWLFTLIFPIAMLVMIGLPNKNTAITDVPVSQGGMSAAVPIMISMAVYGAMVASTMTGVSVAAERAQGWSRQPRLTPLNPVVYILVKVICGLVLGGIAVLVTLIVGAALGITALLGNLILAGVLAWLSSLMLTSLGLAVGYALPAQNAMRYLGPILPILSFMGGPFVPLAIMPRRCRSARSSRRCGASRSSPVGRHRGHPERLGRAELIAWFPSSRRWPC
jgi:ABC-2 type transport system permease protein